MKRQWLFAVALLAFSASAMAVDGYKNLKFGMSEKDALSTKTCSFRKSHPDDKGVDTYFCTDFKAGGKRTNALILFIDGKLARFGFNQSADDALAIMQAMKEKYGEPIDPPSTDQLRSLERVPNDSVDINFDNNTVTIRLTTDDNLNQSILILYSAADFDQKMVALKNAQISSDL